MGAGVTFHPRVWPLIDLGECQGCGCRRIFVKPAQLPSRTVLATWRCHTTYTSRSLAEEPVWPSMARAIPQLAAKAILGQCSANVQHCLTLFNTIHHTFISDSSSATAHAPRTPRRTILLLFSLLSALMLSLSLCNAGIVASGSIWVGFSFILSMSRGISLLFSLLIMDDGWLPYAATI
jgi:hypothetical protein